MIILCAVIALDIQAAVVQMGFYINNDYWAAIEDYPQKVQDEIIGSLTRLYFTGEDQLGNIRSKTSKPVYLACRERVLVARKKSASRGRTNKDVCPKSTQDKSLPRVQDQNSDFAKKSESERENISTCKSTYPETQPNLDESAKSGDEVPWIEFAKAAISKFTEITGRRYDIPSSDVMLSLHKIFAAQYTISDIETMIRYKYDEWKNDTRMSNFIRPKTLFGQQFESYVAAAKAAKEVKRDDRSARVAGRF